MSDWREHAECKNADLEIFFPLPDDRRTTAEAVGLYCLACPVRQQCLAWAMGTDERYGIWGGKTEQQRQDLKRRMARV